VSHGRNRLWPHGAAAGIVITLAIALSSLCGKGHSEPRIRLIIVN